MTDHNRSTGKVSRRSFIKSSAIASGAIMGGGTIAAYAGRARPEQIVAPDLKRPAKLADKKKVVVVGGGLAGLSSAIELAERGFDVELFEGGTHCGGRVGGWKSTVLGEQMTHEHGFHGFFYQYYNLKELIQRTCDSNDYIPTDAYPVACKGKPIDVLHASNSPFPFNMLNVVFESKNLKFLDLSLASPEHIFDMLAFDPVKTFEKWDNTSFKEFCKQTNVEKNLYQYFYDPYVRTMFVRPEEVSAAEMLQMFHSYFVANPEGMGMDILRRPSLDSLIEPMVAYFRNLGGTLHTSSPIHALKVEGDRITGVVRQVPGAPRKVATVPATELTEQGYQAVNTDQGQVFIGRFQGESGQQIKALDSRCTHQGCPVQWHGDKNQFICPCHRGTYNADGVPVAGPPKAPLAPLSVEQQGEEFLLFQEQHTGTQVIDADYVILATDVNGSKAIVNNTQWPQAASAWQQQMNQLTVCRPYSVSRQWLNKPVKPERYPLYTVGGYHPVDEVFLMSQFQEESMQWAKRNNGTVIETHCYALDHAMTSDPEKLHQDALHVASTIIPDLKGAKALHREVQLLENFSGYGMGDFQRRPGTQTPFTNLVLAGDYVRIDLPLELMERATVSGRVAANYILDDTQVQQVAISTPPVRGMLA